MAYFLLAGKTGSLPLLWIYGMVQNRVPVFVAASWQLAATKSVTRNSLVLNHAFLTELITPYQAHDESACSIAEQTQFRSPAPERKSRTA